MTKNKIILTLVVALVLCTCFALTVSADYFELNGNNPNLQYDGGNSNHYCYGVDESGNVLFNVFRVFDYVEGEDYYYVRFSKYTCEYLIDEYYTLLGEPLAVSPNGYDWSAIISWFSAYRLMGPSFNLYYSEYDNEYPDEWNGLGPYYAYESERRNFYFLEGLSEALIAYNNYYIIDGFEVQNNYLINENVSLSNEVASLQNRIAELNEEVRNAYDYGKNDGLQEGYTNGMREANALENGLITVMNAPFYILKGIFNFEIFGINILTIILSIMTLIIVGFIVKLII